ncbi:MAG: hypothetical protein A2Z99_03540 [Treponema sp. GWB1_62_6]|nr:MAG: hypothetical protein A2Z99_03540 [Treponema sp. GWB1_62_6]
MGAGFYLHRKGIVPVTKVSSPTPAKFQITTTDDSGNISRWEFSLPNASVLSRIQNNGAQPIRGMQILWIEKKNAIGGWDFVQTVDRNDSFQLQPGQSVDLNEVFNNAQIALTQSGTYRVHAGVYEKLLSPIESGSAGLVPIRTSSGVLDATGEFEYITSPTQAALMASNIQTTNIKARSATISWETIADANVLIRYGITTKNQTDSLGEFRAGSRSLTLKDLDNNASYQFAITTCGRSGECARTPTHYFNTPSG